MRLHWTASILLPLMLAACGPEEGTPEGDPSPADPAPIGSDVGTVGTDATGRPVPGDSGAVEGAHP